MKYVLLALFVVACTADGDRSSTKLADPTEAVDQELMIALSQAKNFHHKARIFMSDGKADDAIASVRQILALHFPTNAPEADDVRLDARALLAKILVEKGRAAEALQVVEEGLAATARQSFFMANLYTVKGEIHEALAAASTDASYVTDQHHLAIEALDRSIQINKAIQKKLMEER